MNKEQVFVIVGASLAGAKAGEALRSEGFDGRVLIGEEPHRPYERPPLSKDYLRGEAEADKLYVHGEGFYTEHDIELRTGSPVTTIDRASGIVIDATGERTRYDRLLVATGAAAREAALSRRRARRHLLPPVQGRRRPSPPSPRDGHSGGGGGRRVDRRRGGGLGAPDGPGGDHDPFRHCAAASVLGPSTPSKTTVPSPHHRRGCRPRPERARPAQAVGIDMADVGPTLEHQGVGSFTASLDGLLETLEAKRAELARR